MRLFYKHSGRDEVSSLPIGNGQVGALVMGDIERDVLYLNEETVWSGKPYTYRGSQKDYLKECRELLFAEKNLEASELVFKKMLGPFNESYIPVGKIFMEFENFDCDTETYERELSLNTAVAKTEYKSNGKNFIRTYFASRKENAIYVNLEGEENNTLTLGLETELKEEGYTEEDNTVKYKLQAPEHVEPIYLPCENPIVFGDNGMRFPVQVKIISTDGKTTYKNGKIKVENFKNLTFTISIVNIKNDFSDFKTAKAEHIKDYKKRFDRVQIDLGEDKNIPTDIIIKNVNNDEYDPTFFALNFEYGRYLLISSSGENCKFPPNLQGIWCWKMRPDWSSNFTVNINTQMNVWHAMSCGVEEAMISYMNLLKFAYENGKKTAQDFFGCRGFVIAHNVDGWGATNPVGVPTGKAESYLNAVTWGMNISGSGWLLQEAWRYYDYKRDKDFLKNELYPLLKESARFYLDYLTEYNGYLVTAPSTSPENLYIDEKSGKPLALSIATTFDMSVVREVFRHTLKASEILGADDAICDEIRTAVPKLYPYKIGKHGELQEWYKNYEEQEIAHRHFSHLYGMFPGDEFVGQPDLIHATEKTIERRISDGGARAGWSNSWLVNLFAMLENPKGAETFMHRLYKDNTRENLFLGIGKNVQFQIDAIFGMTAGIANCIAHQRGDEIRLLPALPPSWKNGKIKGLRLPDNRAIDLEWKEREVISSRIYKINGDKNEI